MLKMHAYLLEGTSELFLERENVAVRRKTQKTKERGTVVGSKEGELRVVLLAMENDFLEAVEVRDEARKRVDPGLRKLHEL